MSSMIPPLTIVLCAIAAILVVAMVQAFAWELPKRNLTVELRRREESQNTARQAASAAVMTASSGSNSLVMIVGLFLPWFTPVNQS